METEGETRKQRLIVIDGGKQRKEASKGNEVSGHTGDGGSTHTAGGCGGGGCLVGVVFFVSACKEPRDKEREKTGWRGKSNKVENVGTSHSIFHIVLCSHFITTLYRNSCCVI